MISFHVNPIVVLGNKPNKGKVYFKFYLPNLIMFYFISESYRPLVRLGSRNDYIDRDKIEEE